MRWIRPHHPRWLGACSVGLLLSAWAGGLSFPVFAAFAIIFAAGAVLISFDFSAAVEPESDPSEAPEEGALPVTE
jgi:hypothetical protein